MRACMYVCMPVCMHVCAGDTEDSHTGMYRTRGTPYGVLIVLTLGDSWYHCVPLHVRARACVRARV